MVNVDNSTDGHGGAIEWYAEKGLVDNSIFTNNHAYDGGAIYVGSASGKINITKSTFKDNYALAVGGAVSLSASSVTINQSNFYNNKALEGGALYVGGKGETNYVYNSVFEGNNATDGNGGAINWMASSGTIVNSNLTNNNAYYGGGIYFGGLSNESMQNIMVEQLTVMLPKCFYLIHYLTETMLNLEQHYVGKLMLKKDPVKTTHSLTTMRLFQVQL